MLLDTAFLLALILANGALALSEIAIVSARRVRLAGMIEEGSAGAARALALAAEPTRFLSTVQVGITSIGILSGAIGEATLARPLQMVFEARGLDPDYAEPLSLGLIVIGLTYVSLILGELVPKRLALIRPERIASAIAAPMQMLARIGRPVVYVLSASTELVLTLLRLKQEAQTAVTVEEIRVLLEQSATEGVLEPGEQEMMTNVLNLDERNVGAILTPRSDVVFLDLRDSVERNRERIRKDLHDVLPVCDGSLDQVVGIVRARRLLAEVLAGRDVDLRAMAEPALFVPETISILQLIEEFRRTKLSAALVVDEFGGIEGFVSVSDVMTAILGTASLVAESDAAVVRREDGSWLLDGAIDLAALVRALGDDSLPEQDGEQQYHTLGGLAMAALGRVPRVGDVFERGRYRFEVVDMDGNRVDRVLAAPRPASASRGDPRT
jgi:putative hemolysin